MKQITYCTYILRSTINGSHYIGSTGNIKKRLEKHNSKQVKSTARYAPWELIYKESFITLTKAYRRELQIKRYKCGEAFKKLLKQSSI